MKNYFIYQFFINLFSQEENLLVGRETATDKDSAIEQYLQKTHPNDPARRDFIEGYLNAKEVTEERFTTNVSVMDEVITANRSKLGIWL